jgi:hypothetical protein
MGINAPKVATSDTAVVQSPLSNCGVAAQQQSRNSAEIFHAAAAPQI